MNKILISLCASSLVLTTYAGPSTSREVAPLHAFSQEDISRAKEQSLYLILLQHSQTNHLKISEDLPKEVLLEAVRKNKKLRERELRFFPRIDFKFLGNNFMAPRREAEYSISEHSYEIACIQKVLQTYQFETAEKDELQTEIFNISEALKRLEEYQREAHTNSYSIFYTLTRPNNGDILDFIGEIRPEDIDKDDDDIKNGLKEKSDDLLSQSNRWLTIAENCRVSKSVSTEVTKKFSESYKTQSEFYRKLMAEDTFS